MFGTKWPANGDFLHVGARCLTFVQLTADLGDVAQPATTGVGIEAELNGNRRRRQEAELPGGVVFVHAPMMTKGCHRVSRAAKAQRADGSAARAASACHRGGSSGGRSRPSLGVVRVEPRDPDRASGVFECVSEDLEFAHPRSGQDGGVGQVEMDGHGRSDLGDLTPQCVERVCIDESPHGEHRAPAVGIVDAGDGRGSAGRRVSAELAEAPQRVGAATFG